MTEFLPNHPPGVTQVGDEAVRLAHVTDEQIRSLQPRRAQVRERLLDREDWQTLVIIWGGAALFSVIGGFIGFTLASIW